MAEFSDISLLKGLQSLLSPPKDSHSSESDEDLPNKSSLPSSSSKALQHPGSAKSKCYRNPYQPVPKSPSPTVQDWELENRGHLAALDSLPSPEYEIIYKQRVNTEDVFLQMGNKNPSTASCEDIVIKVHLRNEIAESSSQMQLDVEENKLTLCTRSYLLKLPLPQPIDPDKGSARWDVESETFTITLKMKRELDFVNF